MVPALKRRRLNGVDALPQSSSPPFASFSEDEDGAKGRDGARDGARDGETNLGHSNVRSPVGDAQSSVGLPRKASKMKQNPGDGASKRLRPVNRIKGAGVDMLELQTNQLLQELRPRRETRVQQAEVALRKIKQSIENLSPISQRTVIEAERQLIKQQRVAVPFPEPRPPHDAQYQLSFQPPTSINVTGSHAFDLRLEGSDILNINLIVQMPDSLFQEKDYLHHRYFYRRAYYLACLAAGLRPLSDYKLHFSSFHGNLLQPVLEITPKSGESWTMTVMPYLSPTVFIDDRLLPHKASVRRGKGTDTATSGLADDSPSPFYNSTIQADRQTISYLRLVHATAKSCDNFKDACILLRVWLRQRGFSSNLANGGFGPFESTALVAVLLSTGIVSPRYSALQLFKATLQYMASNDCLKSPAVLGETTSSIKSPLAAPILFDAARSHNLLFKMTPWSYKTLKAEARATVLLLSDTASRAFEPTFIFRTDSVNLKYDMALSVPSKLIIDTAAHDHDTLLQLQPLHNVLSRGLTDRITSIAIRNNNTISSWELGSARPILQNNGVTLISLVINPLAASRTIDHGPSAQDKQAAADYRKFWGDKAELRRFKDGSIRESVVWPTGEGQLALLSSIIRHLVKHHFSSAAAEALEFVGGGASLPVGQDNGVAIFSPSMEAYKVLEIAIRSLEELPLAVRQVSPASAQMRFASTKAPRLLSRASLDPIDVVVEFESSARWPNDLQAVQQVKIAFLLRLGSLLCAATSDLYTRVGLENSSTPFLNQGFLDVTYQTPPVTFRIRIHHEREMALIQTLLRNKELLPSKRDDAAAALAQQKRLFVVAPVHTACIARHATRHAALSPTIRLVKKWFAAHHLTSHFPEALVELFCLGVFVQPAPYTAPGTGRTGLYRVLAWLARWDWRVEPLLLPPSFSVHATQSSTQGTQDSRFITDGEAISTAAAAAVVMGDDNSSSSSGGTQPRSKEQWLRQARTRFTAWRRLDPALNRVVLFVASEADSTGTVWSDLSVAGGGPARVAAGRLSALAGAAVRQITGNETGLKIETLFASSLADFDFIVRLAGGAGGVTVARGKEGKARFKNLQDSVAAAGSQQQEVGFDPIKLFLEELKRLYGNSVVFFYGAEGSRVIGGLWNPVTECRRWKVNLAYSTLPEAESADREAGPHARINKEGILGEIARLGGEMIERIDTK